MADAHDVFRKGVSISVFVLFEGLSVQPARAVSVLDQMQSIDLSAGFVYAKGGGSQQKLGRVVTTGISGALTDIRLPVGGAPSLDVLIERVAGGNELLEGNLTLSC